MSATRVSNEKGVPLPGATVPVQVTVDASTILHVHPVLVQVPGSADNCGGNVTVLMIVPVVWPMLSNRKLRWKGWPANRLHG